MNLYDYLAKDMTLEEMGASGGCWTNNSRARLCHFPNCTCPAVQRAKENSFLEALEGG